ncbi:MAG: hypothetical protein CL916_13590 [Deltaproteobacteria bacterium]|nr:hypothetical protein [Deltaproteobacteria bacterium]
MRFYLSHILPLISFGLVQGYFICAQDRSDLPGAAGSWSIYLASVGTPKNDFAASIYLLGTALFPLETTIQILSFLMGGCVVLGTTLYAHSLSSSKSALFAGLLISAWPPVHYLALLFGNDPFSIGLSTLGFGCIFYGLQQQKLYGILISMLGCTLLPISVWAKELALPLLSMMILIPIWLSKRNIWMTPFLGYSFFWSYAWFWPQRSHPEIITHFDLLNGIQQLYDLSIHRMNEGKFFQFLLIAIFGWLCMSKEKKHTILLIVTILGMTITCGLLGMKLRPRYLIVFGVPLCTLIAVQLGKIRFSTPILLCGIIFLLIDTWSHQYVWSKDRHTWMQTQKPTIPKPPQLWLEQYDPIPKRLLRDISLIGAGTIISQLKENKKIATIPLRDERHRSILAYAQQYGGQAIILEPKHCCRTKNQECIHRLSTELRQAGFTLVMPIASKHEPRWDSSLSSWYTHISQNHFITPSSNQYWIWEESSTTGGHTPCQKIPSQ